MTTAPTLQVVRCLLWQAGKAIDEAGLVETWKELAARGAPPTALELLERLREKQLLTGSLLECEEPPALLASASEAAPPGATTATVIVAPPTPIPDRQEPAPPELAPDAPGAWSYELVEQIGQGGMGTVYLAFDRHLLRQSAVKRLRTESPQPGAAERFVYEAQVMSQLDHPNVLPVYALQREADGTAACALKLVRGRTLEALIQGQRGWGPARAAAALPDRLDVFLKVCEGVHYAHARGVLHRDLKPANVMLGDHGEVYVLDWGLCKLVRRAGEPAFAGAVTAATDEAPRVGVELDQTQHGMLKGTPLYFSPEQAQGDPAAIGPASDQYALGLLLYELIALRWAYQPSNLQEVIAQAQQGCKRPWPSEVRVHPDLTAIVNKATALRPADRYGSVRELADDVRRWLRREETRARPDSPARALRRRVERHAGVVVATLAVALALVVGTAIWRNARRRLAEAEERAAASARAKEEQAAQLLLGGRAAGVIRHFLWYARELEGLASAAEQALVAGVPSGEPLYTRARFADAVGAPPDLTPSTHYRAPISPAWPLCDGPRGTDPARLEAEARRLLAIRPRLLELFRGVPEDAGTPRTPRQGPLLPGEAVEWAYVILESSGLIVLLPGSTGAGWEEGFDLRTVPTYLEAKAAAQAGRPSSWSAPYEDLLGQGRLVTRNRALYDPAGALLGVASLDLSLDEVSRRDLVAGDGVRRAALLDGEGRVVVASAPRGPVAVTPATPGGERLALEPYRLPDVVARLAGGTTRGLVRPADEPGTIVVWQRLDPLPWTLLVEVGGEP